MGEPTPLPLHPATRSTSELLDRVVDATLTPLPDDPAVQLTRIGEIRRLKLAADAGFEVGLSRARPTVFAGDGGWTGLAAAVGMTRRPLRERLRNTRAIVGDLRAPAPTDPDLEALARALRNITVRIGTPADVDQATRALADALGAVIHADAAWETLLLIAMADVQWRPAQAALGLSHGGFTYRLQRQPGRRRLADLLERHSEGAGVRLLGAVASRVAATA